MLPDPSYLLAEMRKPADDSDDDLPATTKIKLDVTGSRGKRYCYEFVYTVPTLGQQVEMARIKAIYLPHGSPADAVGGVLVEQVAYLTVTLDKDHLPPWWKPMELYDAAPISALYAEVTSYEARFHRREEANDTRQESEGVAEEGGGQVTSGGPQETGDDVEQGVQPPPVRRKVLGSS